ncbi:hypothetical protein LTR28_006765, partial [Elasticomyces elasticus]
KAREAGVLGTHQPEGGEDLSPTGQRHDNDLCDDPASTQGHETKLPNRQIGWSDKEDGSAERQGPPYGRKKDRSRAWRTWFQPSTYKFGATGHRCASTQRDEDKET